MAKKKQENFFWTSYSDLMTSMFFIMLVLFVLTIILLSKTIGQLQEKVVEQDEIIRMLERVTKIDEQFKPLIESGTFKYYEATKKFVAKDLIGKEIFEPNKTIILDEFIEPTKKIGYEIEKLLQKLSKENPDFSYQMVIEGNMANTYDYSISENDQWGYTTSYQRALAVYLLWTKEGINLRKYNTELVISGSGFNGLDRDNIEEYNKRFSIQIIPKINPPTQ